MRRQTKIYTQRSSKMIQISLSEPSFSPRSGYASACSQAMETRAVHSQLA